MFGIDTQDIQDLKIVDVKVGTGAEAKPGERSCSLHRLARRRYKV